MIPGLAFPKKILHDYKCGVCGKPATKNVQDAWREYDIDLKGNFDEVKEWEGSSNEFYCDECFEKEFN